MGKAFNNAGAYLLFLLVGGSLILVNFFPKSDDASKPDYTTFLQQVDARAVVRVEMSSTSNMLQYEEKDGKKRSLFVPDDPQLVPTLKAKGIPISVKPPDQSGWWASVISTILLPTLILVGILIFAMRQAQSGSSQAMSFGKSRAKMMVENKTRVTFSDVAGVDEAKVELAEIVDFLKAPEKYQALGAHIPKGVLLVGPPGTGKTLLARAVAGEAGVPFFNISGSDFVEMFVGVGASRVRDLFEQAKKNSPCIVFVDEIDAVGRQRGAGMGGGHDEREQTLNQLLVEMDGFEANVSIVVIAATNRPDILDAALLRPGRFDRQVVVDAPDVAGREQILKVHMKNKPLGNDVDLKILARRTPGFTGADLMNLSNEAALIAARRDRKEIAMPDCEAAIDRVIAGPERKSRLISDQEKKVIAFHEVGHALIAKLLPNCDPLHKVTIVSRGMALGLTMTLPTEDRVLTSRSQMMDRIVMMLGGRVAEAIAFNEITTGASNDLERATGLARRMVTEFGMSDKVGPVTFGKRHEHIFLGRDFGEDRNFSNEIASLIDHEIKGIVQRCYERAEELLTTHREQLDLISYELMARETLDADEFDELFNRGSEAVEPLPA
ncbi:MAG: ATP-dependent zinc metalloprotease FtsH [Candidatus Sericytochromatia bacterium]|nr:ATP-dependent zinc metalloprotease FtsH [Candidatus Sericytochromatia bacterium]